jgi:hypothetical protein
MKTLDKFDIYPGNNYTPVESIDDRYKYKRVSRWIQIRQNYNPGKRNRLWDYVMDENGYHSYHEKFNPVNGLFLDYFIYNGKKYALDQFIRISSIADCIGHFTGYIENGEKYYLSGYDSENYFKPIFIELDEYCERVRIYEEIEI